MLTGHVRRLAGLTLLGVGAFFAFALVLLFLFTVRQIIFFLLFSIVLAAALRPAVLLLNRRLPYPAALVIVYLSLLGTMLGAVVTMVPTFVVETTRLIADLPQLIQTVQPIVQPILEMPSRFGLTIDLNQRTEDILTQATALLPEIVSLPGKILGVLFGVFAVVALSFYWLLTRDQTLEYLLSFLPVSRRNTAREFIDLAEQRLAAYVGGLLIASLALGVLAFIGLSLLGVRFAFLLALFAAALEMVPMIGPFIAAVPIVLVAASQSLLLGVATLAFFVVIQQLEGYVITPAVQQRVVRLSPFVVLLAILVGNCLAGIAGALLAIPVVLVLATVLDMLRKPR